MKMLSTSKLADKLEIKRRLLFLHLRDTGYIVRLKDYWELTQKGIDAGGQIREHEEFGKYICWPEDLDVKIKPKTKSKLLSTKKIADFFAIRPERMHLIFSEIGWTEKALKGWKLTALGEKAGAVQMEHKSGALYILWPETTCNNNALLHSLKQDPDESQLIEKLSNEQAINFRQKFPAQLRTKDGHYVRSRAEVIIDNALYDYGPAHAYERKIPIEENVYSDFYIPAKNGSQALYIEFWGMEDDPKYDKRLKIKQGIYKKHELNLIEIYAEHIDNLDDYLPRMLLKYGIRVE